MTAIELDSSALTRSVAFTGRLACMTRAEAFEVVRQRGGTPSQTVTKGTKLLIVGQPSSPTISNLVPLVTVWLGVPPRWRTTSNASARVMQASRPVKATDRVSAELSNSIAVMSPRPALTGNHFWLALFLAGRRT